MKHDSHLPDQGPDLVIVVLATMEVVVPISALDSAVLVQMATAGIDVKIIVHQEVSFMKILHKVVLKLQTLDTNGT